MGYSDIPNPFGTEGVAQSDSFNLNLLKGIPTLKI
jgi:hypothetical protein